MNLIYFLFLSFFSFCFACKIAPEGIIPSDSLLSINKACVSFGPFGPKTALGSFKYLFNNGVFEGRLRLFNIAYGTPLKSNCPYITELINTHKSCRSSQLLQVALISSCRTWKCGTLGTPIEWLVR